jgi:hypothetical protein
MWPRPGRLTIRVCEPILPSDDAFSGSATLAELARQRLLAVLDEPDLTR